MKTTISWVAACIILFIIFFIHTFTDKNYPVSGNEIIQNQNLIYKFDKTAVVGKQFSVRIYQEGENKRLLILQTADDKNFSSVTNYPMYLKDNFYQTEIKSERAQTVKFYRVAVSDSISVKYLPSETGVQLYWEGKIPHSVYSVFILTFFGGILLTLRFGLKNEDDKRHYRKYFIVIISFFFAYAFAIAPLIQSFKLNLFNKYIPTVSTIFLIYPILLFILWVAVFLLYNHYKKRIIIQLGSLTTILIYIFIRF